MHTCVPYFKKQTPKQEGDSNFIYNSSIRANACDVARGLLPAATFSNVGIFGSGQAFESMLIRMNSHPLKEARVYAQMMLKELRKVIPSFLKRVDLPDRGVAWSDYFQENHEAMERIAARIETEPEPTDEVTLVEWDPDAEDKIAAAEREAVEDVRNRAVNAATTASRKLIADKHDAKADKVLAHQVIAGI